VECVEDLLIYLNKHVLLLNHLLIASLDTFLNPVGKIITNDRVSHIEDPLLLEALSLHLEGREVDLKLDVSIDQLHHLLDC
jgi:hypothetical protein